jgi:GTP-binding protein
VKFVDEVSIYIRSGKGGDGAVSFRRERFRPKGGPDGGDGGNGASIIFVADPQLGTLLDFRYHQHYYADGGRPGMGSDKNGKTADDLRIRVPVGTVLSDAETGELIADLSEVGAEVVAAKGGKGGLGNMNFATSTNQAPRYAQPGGPSVERKVRLTLKLLADVGLVGFPNAGKSTLISRLSKARPKIADYPFTTLVPNLGIVRTGEDKTFVMADIPGLIEGASEGAGLGHRFLRHVERVSVLAFLVDVSSVEGRTPATDYETLVKELARYSEDLAKKPRVLVLTKADLPDTNTHAPEVKALADREGIPFFEVSAVRGDGLDPLAYALQKVVDEKRARPDPEPAAED